MTILRPAHSIISSSAGCLWGLVPAAECSGLIRGPLSPSRGPQWPPLSSVEALDEEPSKLCGSPRQDEKNKDTAILNLAVI